LKPCHGEEGNVNLVLIDIPKCRFDGALQLSKIVRKKPIFFTASAICVYKAIS
jgi:hypothetical protein